MTHVSAETSRGAQTGMAEPLTRDELAPMSAKAAATRHRALPPPLFRR